MENSGQDETMLDMAEPPGQQPVSRTEHDPVAWRNGLRNPLAQSEAVITNGSQLVTRSPSPKSPDEPLEYSFTSTRQRSEDPAGLVNQVRSILNLDSPPNGTPASEVANSHKVEEKIPKVHQLQVAMLPTGVVYDIRMRFHCELQPHQRPDDHHPEDPRRIKVIYQALCEAGLAEDEVFSTRPLVPQPLVKIRARNATPQEICLVHDARHYVFMSRLGGKYIFLKVFTLSLTWFRYPRNSTASNGEAV